MYVLNTHGGGKFECLHLDGTTLKGHHYMGKWHYYGTIEYRLIKKDAACDAGIILADLFFDQEVC